MKRDWELVREILATVEDLENTQSVLRASDLEGYDPEIVSYHMKLLDEAGLIEAECNQPMNGPLSCFATRLTWEGHEFIDQIRSDTVWNKTKSMLSEKGIDLSFEVIKFLAPMIIRSMFN